MSEYQYTSTWKVVCLTVGVLTLPFLVAVAGCGNCSDEQKPVTAKRRVERTDEAIEFFETWGDMKTTIPRRLRKMQVGDVRVNETQTSFSHLVFVGKSQSITRNYLDYDVVFAWERKTDEYILSRVPMTHCRFKLSKEIVVPSVSFEIDTWRDVWTVYGDPVRFISGEKKDCLVSVTFTVNESDWQTSIELPLN